MEMFVALALALAFAGWMAYRGTHQKRREKHAH